MPRWESRTFGCWIRWTALRIVYSSAVLLQLTTERLGIHKDIYVDLPNFLLDH